MQQLRAVLFDIDDTLFSTTDFARRARSNAVRAMIAAGLRCSEEVASRELDEVISEFSSNYGHHYDKLLMRLPRAVPAGFNSALIVAAGVVAYHDTKFAELHPFVDVIPLLKFLRSAGLVTGVITHGWTTKQAEKLVRLNLLEHFEPGAVFISDQIGISKPNPKLYQAALRQLVLSPTEVMYVGDNPAHDVEPPASLGMVTVWSRRATRRELHPEDVQPNHIVDDFAQLEQILREQYGIGS